MKKLLEGIKVVDFGWVATGPLTAKAFSDAGAEVIKVENENNPDPLRTLGPYRDKVNWNCAGAFNNDNTNKLSIALNLTKPKGVAVARKLVARADVVIENYAPGVMDKLGLGYEALKKVNPGIIMLSSSMQGQTGPFAKAKGFGTHTSVVAGINHIAGWPDRLPAELGTYTDYIAMRYCPFLILGALEYRRRTGKGMRIDHSQMETGIHFMGPLLLDYSVNQRVAMRMGNHALDASPHAAYRCAGDDRWVGIAVYTEAHWKTFGQVIGNPAWTKDPRFATLARRRENEEEMDALIDEWTSVRKAEDIMKTMQAAGVPAGVLQTGEDLYNDPQLAERHFFWEVEHQEVGKYRPWRGTAYISNKVPYDIWTAPCLGQHTQEILRDILKLTDDEVADLVIDGVIAF